MSMITRGDFLRARHIVEASGAAEILSTALRTDLRGPKGNTPRNCKLFLLGAILNAGSERNFVIGDIHKTLTLGLPLADQFDLGVRTRSASGRVKVLPISDLYNLTRNLSNRLGYGSGEHPDLTDRERARRVEIADRVVSAMLRASQVPMTSGSFAIDGSGVWSWSVGRRAKSSTEDQDTFHCEDCPDDQLCEQCQAREDGEVYPVDADPILDAEQQAIRSARGPSPCQDARWGHKTARVGGTEMYFGYQLHAVVAVPKVGEGLRDAPILIADFDVTAANADIVEVSLKVLDRIRAGGTPVTELLADRHYSYKVPERWALELQRRGIQPVLDLSEADQGWSDFEGARLAGGVPHCPTSPDRLGHLTSPKPNQSAEVQARHHKAIEARRELAFTGNGRTAAGMPRYRCPARSGSVGCPLVPGTVAAAMENGVRVIRDVPLHPGKACTQVTITLTIKANRKVWQSLYWGGPEWRKSYARRTYVEGVFGNLKNPSTENMTRGHFRVTGLLMVRLALTMVAINYNVRHLRRWHDTYGTGPADHPLLQPEPDNHGWKWLTEDEAQQVAADHNTIDMPLAA